MSNEIDPDRWLSVDEIASHLGVNRETVYRWIEDKGLPGHRIGRLWKFNRQEVDSWVRNHNQIDTDK
ncbi:helix-turn-helix domain-containing protein [Prosthecochloris sp. GSB1]|uniref:helix-turn-helix domain-containing protein n=1 Tax=Prosthecochloris sp. GSB1 TaxID=281093 RepID=UPI00157E17F3|nr:helix-turn-helix domain-containing protein [Prosthecochloris sp. GSB1]